MCDIFNPDWATQAWPHQTSFYNIIHLFSFPRCWLQYLPFLDLFFTQHNQLLVGPTPTSTWPRVKDSVIVIDPDSKTGPIHEFYHRPRLFGSWFHFDPIGREHFVPYRQVVVPSTFIIRAKSHQERTKNNRQALIDAQLFQFNWWTVLILSHHIRTIRTRGCQFKRCKMLSQISLKGNRRY